MRILETKLIRLQLTAEELDTLTADFISYKYDGVLPDIFGRGVLYDGSFTQPLIKFGRVVHIHLANENNPFPPQSCQFSRTNDEVYLVYCQGAFNEQAWLLIAILKSEPHKLVRDNNQIYKIGKMAETFRMCLWVYIMNNIQIRSYQPGGFQQLCVIFIRAVTVTASQYYSPQQISAWVQIDESRWKRKFAKSQVWVAIINAQPVGFISRIEHYVDMLFVDPEYTRRGVASALLKPLIKSESEPTADASIIVKPFFERYGFQTVKQRCVECRGAWFTNFYMRYKPQY